MSVFDEATVYALEPQHRGHRWVDREGVCWVFSFGWHRDMGGALHHVPGVDLDEAGVSFRYGPFTSA